MAASFVTVFCIEGAYSIWRTCSRETPNSAAKSSSVIGSSASRRTSLALVEHGKRIGQRPAAVFEIYASVVSCSRDSSTS
jgi:hypothetical protein